MRLSDALEQEAENVAQEVTAMVGAWAARDARPVVKGVCVDGDLSLDRDDAIWFEEKEGKLIIDVSIADVGAFISKDSMLDKHALNVTTSTYKSPVQARKSSYKESHIDVPMLPFRLSEDNSVNGNGALSLSDKPLKSHDSKDVLYRAAMTTRTTIDLKTEQVENVEIFPSIIHPEIINYTQIADDIEQDSNGRYAKWASCTALLSRIRKASREGVLPLSITDTERDQIMRISEEITIEELPAREITASKIVEETALLSNRSAATFFALCSLPYVFRIHKVSLGLDNNKKRYATINEAADAARALRKSIKQPIQLEMERATYSAHREPHAALGEYAYAHHTSPIRRAPDIYCQRMEHWAHATISQLSHVIDDIIATVNILDIAKYIGKLPPNPEKDAPLTGAKVMQWMYQLSASDRESTRIKSRENLTKYLVAMLQDLAPSLEPHEQQNFARSIAKRLETFLTKPPYTHGKLEAKVKLLNANQAKIKPSRRQQLAEQLVLTQIERELELAELQVLSALELNDHAQREEEIANFSADKRLPLTLHLAAQEHLEYRVPATELLTRMQEGTLKEPSDLATILVEMKIPTLEDAKQDSAFADAASQEWLAANITAWKTLKEIILSRFAANPSFTKSFIKHLEERYHWKIHSTHASLIAEGAIAASMSLNPNPKSPPEQAAQETLFSPCFSIGHWGKTTRHHARLELLSALADDALVSADKVKLPRALRLMTAAGLLELISSDAPTLDLLKKKAADNGITIAKEWDKTKQQYTLIVSTQKQDREPIEIVGEGSTKHVARAMAWQSLMRSKITRPIHEDLFRKREKLRAIPVNADEAVKWLAEHDDNITSDLRSSMTNQYTQRREPTWQARLLLQVGKISRKFISESTQKEVAETFANEAGLRYLRERIDYGDKVVEAALKRYENHVQELYDQGAIFSSKVPYRAKMNGREIIAIDSSVNKGNERG